MKRLLIFTNTRRVWRQNTRGDYWVLDLATKKLQKLGGNAAPSTLMFAKFSPDGSKVAYVREQNIYARTSLEVDRPAYTRRLTHFRQWHYRLGLRRGVLYSRRIPLEPGRAEHRLLAD